MAQKGRRNENEQKNTLSEILLEASFWVLLMQLVGTALYFTGRFSNPQTHKEFIAQFAAAVAVGLWFLAQAVRARFRIRLSAIYLPVALLLIWAAFRTFTSVTPLSTRKWLLVAQVVVALPIWVDLLESTRRRLVLSWGIFLIGLVMAAGALIESFGYYPSPLISEYHRQSIGSFVGHNNPMAAYLLMASFHIAGLLFRYQKKSWSKIFWLVLALNLYLILLSGSRGVWLSLPFAVIIFALAFQGLSGLQIEKRTLQRVLGALAAGCLIVIAAVGAQEAFQRDSQTPTIVDRLKDLKNAFSGTYPRVWTMSLSMVQENPVQGVGFAAWSHQYPYYQGNWFTAHPDTGLGLPHIDKHTQRSHSDYLQLGAELGLIGFFLLLWMILIHIRQIWRFLNADNRLISGVVGLAAMTGTMAHGLVYFPFHAADSACPFIANWGLFLIGRRQRDPEIEFSGPSVRWVAAILGLFFLFVATRPVTRFVSADILIGQMVAPPESGQQTLERFRAGAVTWERWAEAYRNRGDMESALTAIRKGKETLEKSMELDPYYPATVLQYARICYTYASMVHQVQGATELYREAIDAIEHSLQTYVWHGMYHLLARCHTVLWQATGDDVHFQKAVESHKKGLEIYPMNYEAVADLGKLYHEHGDDQATMELYYTTHARFIGLEQNFADFIYNRGGVAWKNNHIEDANFYLSVACALDEKDTEKRYGLGLFYLSQDRPDAVLHVLKQHLKLAPDNLELTSKTFGMWIQQGDTGKAAETAVQLFTDAERGPHYEDQVRMVLASFLLNGKYVEADKILEGIPQEKLDVLTKDEALTSWLTGDIQGAFSGWSLWLASHEDDRDCQVGIQACLNVLFGPFIDPVVGGPV